MRLVKVYWRDHRFELCLFPQKSSLEVKNFSRTLVDSIMLLTFLCFSDTVRPVWKHPVMLSATGMELSKLF